MVEKCMICKGGVNTDSFCLEVGKKRKHGGIAYILHTDKGEYETVHSAIFDRKKKEVCEEITEEWLQNSDVLASAFVDIDEESSRLHLTLDVNETVLAEGFFPINYCPMCGRKLG